MGILGPLQVRDAAGAPIDVGGARLRTLLTRLALDGGRPVSVAALVDAVWGAEPPSDEANALQTLVSRLRRALGGAGTVEQSPAGYQLAVVATDVDAARFAALAVDGSVALRAGDARRAQHLLNEALALWRGPALADGGESVAAQATRLHDQRLSALSDRIEADLALGNAQPVIAELEALTAEHPLNEQLAGQLLRALAAGGRQADALAVYERVRGRLADELGIDPSADLQHVHLAVLRGEFGPSVPREHFARTNLRAQLTSFVGREDEVARIAKSLEENRLVTLVGPGGAGKTRLAGEAAARCVEQVPDGVWFVELAPVTDAADVPQTVLGSLGLREVVLLEQRSRAAARDAVDRLLDALADKQTVIILDNCEHLIEATAGLADLLLSRCPGLRVLTTSREPLGIFGEALLVVRPLDQPGPNASVAEALQYPAVQLFADRVGAACPDFAFDETSVPTVVEIVRRLDGLPLAIELAAARLRTLPLREIARRLSDRFRLLTGGSRTAMPRHRTLRAVVEWSWDLLTPAERLLVERLAVFPAGATLESATEVCADEAVPAADVLDLLTSLVDKSLLQVTERGRYRMLETIREYGIERLAEHDGGAPSADAPAGGLRALRQASATYFSQLVAESERFIRTADQLPWIERLNDERDNILAALRFLADERQADAAVRIAAGIGWFWMLMGAHSEAGTWLQYALAVPGGTDGRRRLLAEAMLALNAADRPLPADVEAVEQAHGRLLELSERLIATDASGEPMLLLLRTVIALFAGNDAIMYQLLDEAIASDDDWVSAAAVMFHANFAENEGDMPAMRVDAERALAAFERIGDRWGLASSLQVLGQIEMQDGELDAALAHYRQALRHVTELGAHDDASWMHLRLAEVHARRGELELAASVADRARRLSEASGSTREAVFGSAVQADIARRTGDVERSRQLLEDALRRVRQLPNAHPMASHGLAMMLAISARHRLLDGQVAEAREHLAEAFERGIGTRDMPIMAAVGVVAATFAAFDGEPARAAHCLGAAAGLRGTEDLTSPDVAELTARLRGELGEQDFAARFAAGQGLDRQAAIEALRAVCQVRLR